MPKTYRYTGPAPVELACSKVVSRGSDTTDVDPKHPHDRALIDAKQLTEQPAQKTKAAPAAPSPSTEGEQ